MKRISIILTILITAILANAQTTQFPYYGSFPISVTPATGTFDLEVRLYDAQNGGNQVGQTLNLTNIEVKNRDFGVVLDFGALPFTGEDRFIEISIRRSNSGEAFFIPSPRQQILSVPYAIRSLTSGTADAAYSIITQSNEVINFGDLVKTDDPRLTDDRNPLPGSNNYIQNTIGLQAPANFNISGEGKAHIFSAGSQYNIGANRILSSPGTLNLFVGVGAGYSNTTGDSNTFVGKDAGFSNTTAGSNSFFGRAAGGKNKTGEVNSFFGMLAGSENTTGRWNAFFGGFSGFRNTTGANNSFFGTFSGVNNTTGNSNSFFGLDAGRLNTEGNGNAFFGNVAGRENLTGNNNAFFGLAAGRLNITGSFNAFFGSLAGLNNNANSNSFFGSTAGMTNTIGASNAFFGAGAGHSNTEGGRNSFLGSSAGYNNTKGTDNTFVGVSSGLANLNGSFNTILGSGANVGANNLTNATAIGAGAIVSTSNTIALGRSDGADKVRVFGLGTAGSTQLCRNADNEISTCSSSLRYKTGIANFSSGLNIINLLRPITFVWKDSGMSDLGLGAEEVAAVDENLVIRNKKGEVEGVKYDRLGVVLVNAVKQQQAQIEVQQKQLEEQKKQLETLKLIICSQNKKAEVCR